jgi:hypothetical protein
VSVRETEGSLNRGLLDRSAFLLLCANLSFVFWLHGRVTVTDVSPRQPHATVCMWKREPFHVVTSSPFCCSFRRRALGSVHGWHLVASFRSVSCWHGTNSPHVCLSPTESRHRCGEVPMLSPFYHRLGAGRSYKQASGPPQRRRPRSVLYFAFLLC